MLSKVPIDHSKIKPADLDRQILRDGIVSEMDAINLYEQMAAQTENEKIKTILLDIAKEEKTHIGELQALLLKEDKEYVAEMDIGCREVMKKLMDDSFLDLCICSTPLSSRIMGME